jgi:hypothetical protein
VSGNFHRNFTNLSVAALHWAAVQGRAESLAVLIKAGADINLADHGGWTRKSRTSTTAYYWWIVQLTFD